MGAGRTGSRAFMTRRKLPIGIQTFREIREENHYYVDKTAYAQQMVEEGKHYFLSRPRRFGKSLLVDTLKELFEGNEPLFRGLHVHDGWDWSSRHPVLRLSFGGGNFTEPGHLHANLMAQLGALERTAATGSDHTTGPERLGSLIEALRERAGRRVAVLVDEYDKPILDALDVPDVARANREYLRALYSVIKDRDAHVRFTFLTGVSRSPQRGSARGNPSLETASKVSLFSGLNNLKDITLDPRYSAVCGYTDADLDTVFAPELPGLDRDEIRDWYNGYNWRGAERVYNPFDILLLFDRREFGAWWFETGTPHVPDRHPDGARRRIAGSLDGMIGSDDLLSAFDVDDMATEALLFQTGYLTIRRAEAAGRTHVLPPGLSRTARCGRASTRACFAASPGNATPPGRAQRPPVRPAARQRLRRAWRRCSRAFFASIPYEWHTRNEVARLRGLLRQRFLLVLRGAGTERHGRGQQQPRPAGHGGGLQRATCTCSS